MESYIYRVTLYPGPKTRAVLTEPVESKFIYVLSNNPHSAISYASIKNTSQFYVPLEATVLRDKFDEPIVVDPTEFET